MKLKFSGHGPDDSDLTIAGHGCLCVGDTVEVSDDVGRVWMQAYPDAFRELKPRPRRTRAMSAPPNPVMSADGE